MPVEPRVHLFINGDQTGVIVSSPNRKEVVAISPDTASRAFAAVIQYVPADTFLTSLRELRDLGGEAAFLDSLNLLIMEGEAIADFVSFGGIGAMEVEATQI